MNSFLIANKPPCEMDSSASPCLCSSLLRRRRAERRGELRKHRNAIKDQWIVAFNKGHGGMYLDEAENSMSSALTATLAVTSNGLHRADSDDVRGVPFADPKGTWNAPKESSPCVIVDLHSAIELELSSAHFRWS